jgi:hypothetical protein
MNDNRSGRTGQTSKEQTMNRLAIVALVVGTLSLSGCETARHERTTRRQLEPIGDNEHSLTVVVKSVPPGAKVYGAWSGSPGTLLGTTPLQIKYTRHVTLGEALPGVETGGRFTGTAPVYETLETEFHANGSGNYTTRAFFKCYLLMDGYLLHRLHEQVDDSHSVAFQDFYGGHHEFIVELSPQAGVVAPVGQQGQHAQAN